MSRSGPAFETSTRETPDWRDQSACRAHPRLPVDDWFPDGKSGHWVQIIQGAKNVCWNECTVRAECKAFALETRQPSGIWGGQDEDGRAAELRRVKRDRAAARKREDGF